MALKPVHRTANTRRTTVEDMGIDHRRFDVTMAQKFLDGSNIVTEFKQVRGKRMDESSDPVTIPLFLLYKILWASNSCNENLSKIRMPPMTTYLT